MISTDENSRASIEIRERNNAHSAINHNYRGFLG